MRCKFLSPVALVCALAAAPLTLQAAIATQAAVPSSEAAQAGKTAQARFSDAFQAALAHDPQLRSAWKTHQAEREETPRAKGALLPNAELSAGYSFEDSENYFTENPTITDDPRADGQIKEHHWQVSVEQPLFNWSAWKSYQAAQEAEEASVLRYSLAERELILRVTTAYLDLLFAARQEYLYQQQLETQALQQTQAQREQELGVGDRITLLEIQAQLDLTRTDLLEARSNYADARTRLENMTGQKLDIPATWRIAEHQPQPETVANTEGDWVEQALGNLQYQEIQALVRQAEMTRESRRAGHYPTANLSLSYIDRDSDDQYRTRQSLRVGVDLRLPLYQGGRTQAALRQADAQMQAEAARSDQALAEARQQVRLNYNRVTSLASRLDALKQSEASTRSFLEAATRGMDLNLRSQIDVLDARNQLLDVQLRYAEALKAYLEADMQLRHAVGQLTPERLQHYDALFNRAAEKVEQAGQI